MEVSHRKHKWIKKDACMVLRCCHSEEIKDPTQGHQSLNWMGNCEMRTITCKLEIFQTFVAETSGVRRNNKTLDTFNRIHASVLFLFVPLFGYVKHNSCKEKNCQGFFFYLLTLHAKKEAPPQGLKATNKFFEVWRVKEGGL